MEPAALHGLPPGKDSAQGPHRGGFGGSFLSFEQDAPDSRVYDIENQGPLHLFLTYDIDEWELFDLQEDPRQLHNLYGKPGTEALTDSLRKELVRLQLLYDDPIREKNGF